MLQQRQHAVSCAYVATATELTLLLLLLLLCCLTNAHAGNGNKSDEVIAQLKYA
jgi:hypothetical protein